MALLRSRTISASKATGFSLVELMVAACLGLLVWGVVLQALVADGRQVDRLVRQVRERGQQQRVLALLRGDLQRATRVDLALGVGAACGLGGRDPVLQLTTAEGPITYTVGSAPSAIWRGRVLMRCGPAFGLHGEPSAGAAQNRVLLDGLNDPGLEAALEPDGLLRLRLRQEFESAGGGTQRIETEARVLTGS
ncbi:type II secretion system protein J [Cyanobium sp. N5-Cardenillas]|uniref:PulJ/GspJ family protein n=1 Tax=Cyanobium sp. N5-Cardenillas TaxID=2823720 RepID=UPI0020CE2C3B|nr:prepilin-type cleavage/methylation domain-containing protein [Cyanobium sp. N5-Cardenillas]MCP9785720.1 prepilin-type cleavage/methylation domain-containing protein [Cyanobium sp. N5-Cardenillas]